MKQSRRFAFVAGSHPEGFLRSGLVILAWVALSVGSAQGPATPGTPDYGFTGPNPLELPALGSQRLRILSPTLLELSLINTQPPDGRPESWDFVGTNRHAHLPEPTQFAVTVNTVETPVKSVGFKRRVLFAPLKPRDLRIANELYLELGGSVPDGAKVSVTLAAGVPGGSLAPFTAQSGRLRWSPAIHVNQVGYVPAWPKQAWVGYYLGSLGELEVPSPQFQIVTTATGAEVYTGRLIPRSDRGFPYSVPPYQKVWEADFSAFKTPGEYRLVVPGLGASLPFHIDEGAVAAFARTYALGLYHQRCGGENALPYTRFTHEACHLPPAEIPTAEFKKTALQLTKMSADWNKDPRHVAPPLKDVGSSLYPFVATGTVDVAGGHHDAGDYSKYTINSAQFIHQLVFAVDAFDGAGDLDNLGLPESGDGKSDLLQLAKWEADFLAKLQDTDGGFYFLVYPRERAYENNVLPDRGDPQVVFPKNTAATAAAVAALAQTASSPRFQREFPVAAALYRQKAKQGWDFLTRAIARHGRDGSYQKITHYGDTFIHDDELAWAATEMYLATGDPAIHAQLLATFDPSKRDNRKWTWVRMFESYGCAIRSYAFAARTGRVKADRLDAGHLQKCVAETVADAADQIRYAQSSAYGTSFPDTTKRFQTASWYFSEDAAFDILVGDLLKPRPDSLPAILSNMNYEGGANPNNVTLLTGLGWKRQREIVHQYARNDRRVLPPTGIPIGNVQSGFMYLDLYKKELGLLTFPSDGDKENPYPFYDRWADSFNVTTEFVAVNQARALAGLAALMARTSLKDQAWRAAPARILGIPDHVTPGTSVTARFDVEGLDPGIAQIVWETGEGQPEFGRSHKYSPAAGARWIEAEAQWPDGRRAFAAFAFEVSATK